MPETEWRGQTDVIAEEGALTRDENAENEDDVVEEEIDAREKRILQATTGKSGFVQVTAKVVGIIKRNWRTYLLSPLQPPSPSLLFKVRPSLVQTRY